MHIALPSFRTFSSLGSGIFEPWLTEKWAERRGGGQKRGYARRVKVLANFMFSKMCGHKDGLLDDACRHLFAAGVLGDSLGSFADCVLGQFTRQEETNCGLDFARRDRFLLVLERETRSFGSDTLEDIVDEGVHDAHGLGRYSDIGMDLLQDVVDVDSVCFLSLSLPLLLARSSDLSSLLSSTLLSLLRHLGGLFSALGRCWCTVRHV